MKISIKHVPDSDRYYISQAARIGGSIHYGFFYRWSRMGHNIGPTARMALDELNKKTPHRSGVL